MTKNINVKDSGQPSLIQEIANPIVIKSLGNGVDISRAGTGMSAREVLYGMWGVRERDTNDPIKKAYGSENLKDTHGEQFHSDADREMLSYLNEISQTGTHSDGQENLKGNQALTAESGQKSLSGVLNDLIKADDEDDDEEKEEPEVDEQQQEIDASEKEGQGPSGKDAPDFESNKSFSLDDLIKAMGQTSMDPAMSKITAAREGSKGGNVIGHTGSGKAIYDSRNHPSHKSFGVRDHMDAYAAHKKMATSSGDVEHRHQALAHMQSAHDIQSYHNQRHTGRKYAGFTQDDMDFVKSEENNVQKALNDLVGGDNLLSKAVGEGWTPKNLRERGVGPVTNAGGGEGSRGGKIIGHTNGGHAIYEHPTHANTHIQSMKTNDHIEAQGAHEMASDEHFDKKQEYEKKLNSAKRDLSTAHRLPNGPERHKAVEKHRSNVAQLDAKHTYHEQMSNHHYQTAMTHSDHADSEQRFSGRSFAKSGSGNYDISLKKEPTDKQMAKKIKQGVHENTIEKKKSELDEVFDMVKAAGQEKVGEVMGEFKAGTLHSGTGKEGKKGPKVTSREQAIAIGMSEAGLSKKSFVKAIGPGGIQFEFGDATGNPIADQYTKIMRDNVDPTQMQIAKDQHAEHQHASMNWIKKGEEGFVQEKRFEETEESRKQFSERHGEFFGKAEESIDKSATLNNSGTHSVQQIPDVELTLNGETLKPMSETDAYVLQMHKSLENIGGGEMVMDAGMGGNNGVVLDAETGKAFDVISGEEVKHGEG